MFDNTLVTDNLYYEGFIDIITVRNLFYLYPKLNKKLIKVMMKDPTPEFERCIFYHKNKKLIQISEFRKWVTKNKGILQ